MKYIIIVIICALLAAVTSVSFNLGLAPILAFSVIAGLIVNHLERVK